MATIIGTNGNNPNLNGTGANDRIFGRGGNDTLRGFGGNDQLFGGSEDDLLFGNGGNDQIHGDSGDDTLNGGSGNDQLHGGSEDDTLNGGTGNDTLLGFTGDDQLNGGDGNDRLLGGSGDDVLNGGGGSNTADYSTATAGVTVGVDDLFGEFPSGEPQDTGGAGIDTLIDIDHIIGSDFDDRLVYDGLEDGRTLNGGNGDDLLEANHNADGILNGGAGNDTLFTGNGFATLNGGTGNDHLTAHDEGILNGGDGNDLLEVFNGNTPSILNGGAGADTLHGSGGGSGGDTFDYNAVSDSPAGVGRDTIVNFFEGDDEDFGDQIDLTDINVTGLSYVGGILRVNTDADAAAEMEINLLGVPLNFATDILV